jgi:hypothetical protein
MPILTIELRGPSRGVVLSGRVLIGRWRGCGIPVGHPSVSRLHAWVDRQGGGQYYIADALSRSGTLINGQPIEGHHLLSDGDKIGIGPATITYRLASALPKDCTPLQVAFSGAARNATTSGILFACSCGAPLWVASNLAGRQGRCRFCGRLIQIPRASVVPPAQMSTKPATAPKDKVKPGRPEAVDPAALVVRRPAAPASAPAAAPADLVPIDEGGDVVDIDARPAGEAHAGHRTFAGFSLPPNASGIVPPSTPHENTTRRPLPTPKPREASHDLSVDERLDLLTEVPTSSSSSAATQMPPAPRAAAGPALSAPPAPRTGRTGAAGQAAAAGTEAMFKPRPVPQPEPMPVVDRADPLVLKDSQVGEVANPAPRAAGELDSFSSLSIDGNDAAERPAFPDGERPTGLLTSGVATNTADSVPEMHVTRPPEFPPVPERRARLESPLSQPPADAEPPVASGIEPPVGEQGESAGDANSSSDVERATLAEAVFAGAPHETAGKASSSRTVEGQLVEPNGDGTTPRVPASRPEPLSPQMVVLIGSGISWLLGAFTFGVPSFVVAAFATAFLVRRETRRPSVIAAAILGLVGGLIGIAVSMAWWVSKPIFPFPWKAW